MKSKLKVNYGYLNMSDEELSLFINTFISIIISYTKKMYIKKPKFYETINFIA